MTKRSFRVLTGGVLVLALVVMGAGFPARPGKPVSPGHWVSQVCDAFDTLKTSGDDSAADLEASLRNGTPDLAFLRQTLVEYVQSLDDTTTITIQQIEAAGVPRVPHGRKIATGLVAALRTVQASWRGLGRQASAVSIDDRNLAVRQFKALARRATATDHANGKLLSGLSRLGPHGTLDRAYRRSVSCRALER
jgi:hypothetical protein